MKDSKILTNLLNNKDLQDLSNFLFPFTKRVYLVGGCVRDALLGKSSKDFDLEVYDLDIKTFENIMQKLKAKAVGKSFFVYKWRDFDISLPRTETKIGDFHTSFDVKITDNEKIASKRRDFTINSIMLNIFTSQVLDFWDGIKDLKQKKLKHISDKSFIEDPLRVLRAMQFSTRFGFRVDKKTVNLCKKSEFNFLSKERIFIEFEKLFLANQLCYGLFYAIKLDIFQKILQIKIDKKDFFKICFLLRNAQIKNEIKKYLFLYVLWSVLLFDKNNILKKINAPKEYKKILKIKRKFQKTLRISFC